MKALKTLEGHAIQGLPLKVYDMSAMKTADCKRTINYYLQYINN